MVGRVLNTTAFSTTLHKRLELPEKKIMILWVLQFLVSCAVAAPHTGAVYSGISVLGPSYHAPIVAAAPAVAVAAAPVVPVAAPKGSISYTATNVHTETGAVKQQTAVGKDALGGHVIRHSAQASNVDPHSGQTDLKHDEHEFHINPYLGAAAVHSNNAEGSLNPSIGQAAFAQKTHEAKIAPGHASVADVKETAAVSAFSSAASKDVSAARTDVVHDGIAKNAHASHKSYVSTPGLGGQSKAAETNHQSFDGPVYGNLHYDSQSADEAYDALGHAAANEQGYKLDQAYDARVNLGASNELQYSRHAAHDPYGNYGAVTQTRQASQGGQLVPVVQEQPALIVSQPTIVKEVAPVVPAPVVYSQPEPVVYQKQATYANYEPEPVVYQKQATYANYEPAPVAYQKQALVYNEPSPISYQKQSALVYNEPAPVSYQKQSALIYNEPVPISYKKQPALVYNEPTPVAYQKHSSIYYEPRAVYKQPAVYGKSHYSNGGYYRHGY